MLKLFKSDKEKTISTKNLFLLEYVEVLSRETIPGKTWIEEKINYSEKSLGIYVVGRRREYHTDEYEDIFTGTTYSERYNKINPGEKRVEVVSPIISNEEEITYEEALSILETHNFFYIKKSYQEKTKELMEMFQNFNTLINTNPDEAEEQAKIIINIINNYNESVEKQTNQKQTLITEDVEGKGYARKRN